MMTVQLCRACNASALSGSRYCTKHIEYHRNYHRNQNKRRLDADLCTQCGKKAILGRRRCEKCRILGQKAASRSKDKKIKNGICIYCTKKVLQGFDRCMEHLTRKQLAILGKVKPVVISNPYVFVAIAAGGVVEVVKNNIICCND